MGFLEADKFNFRDLPYHPSRTLDFYENVYPYLINGRPGHNPEITVSIHPNAGVSVNEEVLLMYIRGLTATAKINGEICEVPVHDKLDQVIFHLTNDYTREKKSPLGRTTTPFIPGIVEIEVFLDNKYKGHRKAANYYRNDIALSFFLDNDESDWIVNFWRNFEPDNPKHREIALNQTALHEIKHISQSVQKFVDLYRSLLIAEEDHNMRLLGREKAIDLLDQIYSRQRLHIPPETDAEAYSIRALKLIYDTGELPKILTVTSARR